MSEWKQNQSLTSKPVKVTIPGPMTITDTIANTHYTSDEEMGNDLAIAINVEIKRLVDAGCKFIQVDEPLFARKPKSITSGTVKPSIKLKSSAKKRITIINNAALPQIGNKSPKLTYIIYTYIAQNIPTDQLKSRSAVAVITEKSISKITTR